MIRLNIEQWKDEKYKEGTLLFAQTLLECVFMYSFDSYKAPALNIHFLCYDFTRTVNLVEQKVMQKGNLIPLYEELNFDLENDITLQNYNVDRDIFYTFKDKNGKFYSLDNVENVSSKKVKDSVLYLLRLLETNSRYLNSLFELLLSNIKSDSYQYSNMQNIVELTRAISTELINSGYSKVYLYNSLMEHFFDENKQIEDNITHLNNFIELINLKPRKYKVVLGINGKTYNFLENIVSFSLKKAKGREKAIYNIQKGWICEIEDVNALDPYSAHLQAMEMLRPIVSIQRLAKHSCKYSFSNKARVIDKQTNKNVLLNIHSNPMKIIQDTKNESAKNNMLSVIEKVAYIPQAFFKMLELHTCALDNKDKINQLLNLWTIIEIFVETDNNDTDKINQICNNLSTIMCSDYLNLKLARLFKDIISCCAGVLEDYLPHIIDGEDLYEKFVAFVSLKKHEDSFCEMIDRMENYPLLQFRLRNFRYVVFKDSQSIMNYLDNHANRLKWHIMRIYRNRNMIVHDGEHMPYIDTIIENLHYYVDNIFSKLISYYKGDLFSMNDIIIDLKNKELAYHKKLGKSTDPKKKSIAIDIDENNYLHFILGNSTYSVNVDISPEVEQYV